MANRRDYIRCGTSSARIEGPDPFVPSAVEGRISTSLDTNGDAVKKSDVFEFFRRLAELNPDPQTELEYRDPYTLVVAVALSAQATDVSVNLATR
jgi:hypothetical protein